jgi:branched-chain amino acid transport system ATP-binding protein/urea transport system ATP-binding protein
VASLTEVAVAARDIVVELDETRILNGSSLTVEAGKIHALIGPNGAGKTTLANVLTGHVKPISGTVDLYGEPLAGRPWRRSRRGMGRKFQIPRVFPRLTGEQNLLVARARSRRDDQAQDEAVELDIGDIRAIRGELLSHGWRQKLEMLMVSSQRPRFAVLDEPTAGMTRSERSELAEIIVGHRGVVTYLVVEHDMDFIRSVADSVSFMHEGRVTVTGSFEEIESNATVRQIYLGEVAQPSGDAPSRMDE